MQIDTLCIIYWDPWHIFFWISIATRNENILGSSYWKLLKWMYQTDNGWEKQKTFLHFFGPLLHVFFFSKHTSFFLPYVAGRSYNKEDAEFLVAFGINFGNPANK